MTVGEDRLPSVAGLLALGIYPQQHLPGTGLQAVLAPGPERSQTRALDSRRFDGPIPRMLADALAWVSRSSPTEIRAAPNGVVRDVPAWPTAAVRELIGNALIHRDLAPWALGETPLLRLDRDRLVTKNPEASTASPWNAWVASESPRPETQPSYASANTSDSSTEHERLKHSLPASQQCSPPYATPTCRHHYSTTTA